MPNNTMSTPANLFTSERCGVILAFPSLTKKLRIIHQKDAPKNTPKIRATAVARKPELLPNPNPVNMTAKFKIVEGFVIINKKVDKYIPESVSPFRTQPCLLAFFQAPSVL